MPQIFHPRMNGLTRILLAGGGLVVVTFAVVAYFVNRSPYSTGQGAIPEQPVAAVAAVAVGGLLWIALLIMLTLADVLTR